MQRHRTLCLAVVVGLIAAPGLWAQEAPRWWKGNLHTHSLWSDGNDFPEMIMEWYKQQGYHFLGLSDHNVLAEGQKWVEIQTDAQGLEAGKQKRQAILESHRQRYLKRFGESWVEQKTEGSTVRVRLKTLEEYRGKVEEPGRFLVLQNEEITDAFEKKAIHVVATNVRELIKPQQGSSVLETMQRNIDAVWAQRQRTGQPMLPHLAHPNYKYSVSLSDMIQLQREPFFEIYNGHPGVNNRGSDKWHSVERMWDAVLAHRLARGEPVLYGLAADDAHFYEEGSNIAPGRGWVVVRAAQLTAEALIAALERGDFYSSTGVTLAEVQRQANRLTVRVEAEPGVTYRIQFIGTGRDFQRQDLAAPASAAKMTEHGQEYSDTIGQVLHEVQGAQATYTATGDELYVRAKVISSKLHPRSPHQGEVEMAWTQPMTGF